MKEARIVDRGDGPKIEGTRITVYTVLEYLRDGRSRDSIAAIFGLSSAQVQAAMDYIREHESEVNAAYERIMARIAAGNPPHIQELLKASHEKMQAKLAQCKADADRDVQVTIEPAGSSLMTQDEWRNFVLSNAGSITDPSFVRHPQGEFESREKLP
jgi:uncharacterized protein (DUF433 family)